MSSRRLRARARLPRPRDRLSLGQRGLRISPFLQGMTADPGVIGAAFDAGVNFFLVSSDVHWPRYGGVREGLARLFRRRPRVRDQVVVAAISYVVDPPTAYQTYRELLEAVPGLERIDVLMAGMVRDHELEVRLPPLETLVARGDLGARATGATFHVRATAVAAQRERRVDLVCLRHNPRHPRGLSDTFPRLDPASPSRVFLFKTTDGHVGDAGWPLLGLGDDHWRPRPPDFYRFALSAPRVDGLIVGLCRRREVRELVEALRSGPLDERDQRYLVDLARRGTVLGVFPPVAAVYPD